MAIKQNIETEFGVNVNECILRVEYPSLTKNTLSFNLRKYASIDKPFFGEEFHTCEYNFEGQNPFKQAYEYLKTLPEFEDSEDC